MRMGSRDEHLKIHMLRLVGEDEDEEEEEDDAYDLPNC